MRSTSPTPTYYVLEKACGEKDEALALSIFNDPRFDRSCRHPRTGCTSLHMVVSSDMQTLALVCLTPKPATAAIPFDVATTMGGFTPLHLACMKGTTTSKAMVTLLIAHDAETTI